MSFVGASCAPTLNKEFSDKWALLKRMQSKPYKSVEDVSTQYVIIMCH